MWFLAWREIRHGRVRFALTAVLVGLVAFLVFVMTGLSVGLGEAGVSGLRRLPGDLVVFGAGAERVASRSELPAAMEARLRAVPGVAGVEPAGLLMADARTADGEGLALALTGLRPGSAAAVPGIGADRVVLSTSARRDGVRAGDVLEVQPGGLRLTVAGFADLGSVQHTAVAQLPLDAWRRARPHAHASVYLVRASGDPAETAAAITRQVAGTEAVTKAAAIRAVPGYAAETGTIQLIRGFLLAVTALLIGTVFWIFTMQKEGSLAVLRATGARRSLLVGSYLTQVAAITLLGLGAGLLAVLGAGGAMPAGAFTLRTADLAWAAGLLAVLALTASAASLRRLLTVDPLLSLGRNG